MLSMIRRGAVWLGRGCLWSIGLAGGVALAAPPPGVLDDEHAEVRAVAEVQGAATPTLMAEAGVLGTAVGLDENGDLGLVVFLDRDHPRRDFLARSLPRRLRGVGLSAVHTDRFVAYARKSSGGGGGGGGVVTLNPTVKQVPPIYLGTSGGWGLDMANGFCCGGTLGALINAGGSQYILSNYHVFEADIVPGGNGIVAQTGGSVVQPGLLDANCDAGAVQTVGSLVKLGLLPNNGNVDASVAKVAPGMVRSDGSILGIGTLSARTVPAALSQRVKKSGRTTGVTRSSIVGINGTLNIAYENECAGGTAFTKTFTGQIVVANGGGAFSRSGDSGAVLVEDVTTNPRAVGLLFAGGDTSAVANPINEVLSVVGKALGGKAATMVGR